MPSTWSCQNTLSSSTSGYQRYWMNSVPAHSPAGWSFASGSVRVTVPPLIESILRISIPSVPSPTPMNEPAWNLAAFARVSEVAPVSASAVSWGSSTWYGRTECS